MNLSSFEKLYIHELKDLYSAERQLLNALPKVIKKVKDETLRAAIEEHLEETKRQKERLEKIFENLDAKPTGVKCEAMAGLIEETQGILKEKEANDSVRDAAIIAGAQRIEHYEISGYGTARRFAKTLGREDDVKLLNETLDEESGCDEKLNKIAINIVNKKAAAAE